MTAVLNMSLMDPGVQCHGMEINLHSSTGTYGLLTSGCQDRNS